MRITALEQLADKGMVFIQKKGGEYLVECVRRDENGFLAGRVCVWGTSLEKVLEDLLEKVTLEN